MNKRGVSPVVATVLLIGIVVVIGLIVFMWFRGISEEAITKFDDQNVKIVCEDVALSASSDGTYLYISNDGNVPVYKVKLKTKGVNSDTTLIDNSFDENWPSAGLLQGMRSAIRVDSVTSGAESMMLSAVLVGSTSDQTQKTHTCDSRHDLEVLIE